MSYYDDDDDLNNGGGQQNPLRKVVKDLEKKLEAADKRAQEAEEKLNKASRGLAQRTVADVLKDKGADPRLSKYVIRDLDGEEVTTEAVDKWLATDGELFGYKPQSAGSPAEALGLPADTVLPPDLVAAYEAFTKSQGSGTPAPNTDPVMAKLNDPNLTREQLEALIYAS